MVSLALSGRKIGLGLIGELAGNVTSHHIDLLSVSQDSMRLEVTCSD